MHANVSPRAVSREGNDLYNLISVVGYIHTTATAVVLSLYNRRS
jgi:hypothetical protein